MLPDLLIEPELWKFSLINKSKFLFSGFTSAQIEYTMLTLNKNTLFKSDLNRTEKEPSPSVYPVMNQGFKINFFSLTSFSLSAVLLIFVLLSITIVAAVAKLILLFVSIKTKNFYSNL